MTIVPLIGIGIFMLTSLVVGVRVIALWLRTRKLPELLLGISVLSMGFLAFAVGTAAKLLIGTNEELRGPLIVVGLTIEYIGSLAIAVFAWRVFHPGAKWATGVASLIGLLFVAAYAGELVSTEYLRYADSQPMSGPFVPLGLAARGLGPAWMAGECLRYHTKLRRRLRLGLADRLIVHRVGLWGIAIGATALAYVVTIGHRLIYGTGLREHVWALGAVSALGMVSAICIGIAFFPPRTYRSWAHRSSAPPPEGGR
jgi:hypothetical protein